MTEKAFARYIGDGRYVVGVPARDLTREEWDALNKEQKERCSQLYQIAAPSIDKDEARRGASLRHSESEDES